MTAVRTETESGYVFHVHVVVVPVRLEIVAVVVILIIKLIVVEVVVLEVVVLEVVVVVVIVIETCILMKRVIDIVIVIHRHKTWRGLLATTVIHKRMYHLRFFPFLFQDFSLDILHHVLVVFQLKYD